MNAIRIDLMASAAGKIGGVTWHHLYLVAVDATGKAQLLRAGPECLPLERLVGRKAQHGNAVDGYRPSPVGPYGSITFLAGAYEPGGVDFDPVAANVTVATGEAAAKLWQKLQQTAHAMQGENIPYDPAGKGANWAIMETLRRCGVEASLPPKRWAPGARLIPLDPTLLGTSNRRLGSAVIRTTS